eukprot:Skav210867  [mRNA]  locus=scaffold4964:75156:77046:- [translate_table: standard]
MGAARADQWLAAAAPKKLRPDANDGEKHMVSVEILRQVEIDMARTYSKMLFGYQALEEEVEQRRQQVTHLMIKWLRQEEKLTYMQGMNHVMATCFREIGEENAALQVFDSVIRQADENLFHPHHDKLFAANQALAEKLRVMVREESPKVAQRLAAMDIDYFPMIVQNWLIDMFLHVLPTEAAARLWDHVLASQGVPLKFAMQLLLSGKKAILSCDDEDLQEVFSQLPSQIVRPEDVDILLHSDLADKTDTEHFPEPQMHEKQTPEGRNEVQASGTIADPLLGDMPPVQVLQIKPVVRMPRRWQPWKFVTVAMVIPWLLMTATQLHEPTLSKQVAPPTRRKASPSLPSAAPWARGPDQAETSSVELFLAWMPVTSQAPTEADKAKMLIRLQGPGFNWRSLGR